MTAPNAKPRAGEHTKELTTQYQFCNATRTQGEHAISVTVAEWESLKAERDALAAQNRELVEALDDVLRDRLTQANLHQLPRAMRVRLEKARALLAKVRP